MAMVKSSGEQHLVRILCFLTDMLLFLLALHVATLSVAAFINLEDLWAVMLDRLSCVVLFGAASIMAGTYKAYRLTDRFDAIYFVLLALLVALVAQSVLTKFVMRDAWVLSRRELLLSVLIAAPLLASWRFFAAGFLTAHFQSLHRFNFVLGDQPEARRIAAAINQEKSLHAQASATTLDALKKRCASRDSGQGSPAPMPEDVIIAHTGNNHDGLTEIIEICDASFNRTFLYPTQHDAVVFQHHNLQAVAGIPLIQVAGQQRGASYPHVKRLMDIVVSATGLVLASPLLLMTAVAVKLTSSGPILFVHERLGRDGRPFSMYKFRSMFDRGRPEEQPVRAEPDDPRITAVGRVIRKYKIDEIPQLFNVLRGDMSLVGPRPLWEAFFEDEPAANLWRNRLTVRPGLTSLSHVLSSSHFTPADLLRYDLMYIKNRSFIADLRILFATVRIVLSGKGGQ